MSFFKITTLLIAVSYALPVFAEYKMYLPLEVANKGSLPDGSINFGDDSTPPDNGETPSNNCLFDDGGTYVITLKADEDGFKAGDKFYWYNTMMIGWHSPSKGFTSPAGLSMGEFKFNDTEYPNENYHELCADDPDSYPRFIPPQTPDEPEEPDEETPDPDFTPECLPLDTTNNYVAYDTISQRYEFHSVTYGLNHVDSGKYYMPPDYDPDRAGSYAFLREVNDAVSGPKPNNWYNAICRVKKMAL